MTESLLEQCDPEIRGDASEIEQELEGLGSARLFFVDLERLALERPPPPKPTLGGRMGEPMGVVFRGLPAMLGLRRSRRTLAA